MLTEQHSQWREIQPQQLASWKLERRMAIQSPSRRRAHTVLKSITIRPTSTLFVVAVTMIIISMLATPCWTWILRPVRMPLPGEWSTIAVSSSSLRCGPSSTASTTALSIWRNCETSRFRSRIVPCLSSSSSSSEGGRGMNENKSFENGNNDDDNDEIIKLVSKRNQIMQQIKRTPDPRSSSTTSSADPSGIQSSSQETLVPLDLDQLPSLKTERPVIRRSSSPQQDEEGESETADKAKKRGKGKSTGDSSTTSSSTPPLAIVDYMAGYPDENDLHIPNRIGVTTKYWGDIQNGFVPSGKLSKRMIKSGYYVPGDLQLAYNKLMEGGIFLLETALTYGSPTIRQQSQLSAIDILNRCIQEQSKEYPDPILMASTDQSLSWLTLFKGRGSVSTGLGNLLDDTLHRLGNMANVDLFQVRSSRIIPMQLFAQGLVSAIESGQCNYIGVQGLTHIPSIRRLIQVLQDKEITLTSLSFDYSLTNRQHESLLKICTSLSIIPIVTNPLDDGLASGVYTATNPSGGGANVGPAMLNSPKKKKKLSFSQLERWQPLHSVQETLAERVAARLRRELRNNPQQDLKKKYRSSGAPPPPRSTDITTTQIALNYIMTKGGVPLVPIQTPTQADEVLGCLGWTLLEEEIEMLEAAITLCR